MRRKSMTVVMTAVMTAVMTVGCAGGTSATATGKELEAPVAGITTEVVPVVSSGVNGTSEVSELETSEVPKNSILDTVSTDDEIVEETEIENIEALPEASESEDTSSDEPEEAPVQTADQQPSDDSSDDEEIVDEHWEAVKSEDGGYDLTLYINNEKTEETSHVDEICGIETDESSGDSWAWCTTSDLNTSEYEIWGVQGEDWDFVQSEFGFVDVEYHNDGSDDEDQSECDWDGEDEDEDIPSHNLEWTIETNECGDEIHTLNDVDGYQDSFTGDLNYWVDEDEYGQFVMFTSPLDGEDYFTYVNGGENEGWDISVDDYGSVTVIIYGVYDTSLWDDEIPESEMEDEAPIQTADQM